MKDLYGKECNLIGNKKLYLFDMDGTIYLGDRLFDGIKELFGAILHSGGKYVFVTNNSAKSVTGYVEKLNKMGIDVTENEFYTSTQATARLLKDKYGERLIYAQGTTAFVDELKASGLNVTTEFNENAAAIAVGNDFELTFGKMENTCKMLTLTKADYYATNPDWVCPMSFGYVPDCGSMCEGYYRATGRKPVFIGKPEPTMILSAMDKLGATKAETVVLGDRIYTDIAAGVNAGVDTVCVLSGEVTRREVDESEIRPTYLLERAVDLLQGM